MEAFALPIYRAGHLPVLGEWFALPLLHLARSEKVGDEVYNESSTPSRSGCWKSGAYCEWVAHPKAQT